MKDEEIKKIIQLRKFAIDYFNKLENKDNSISVSRTQDVAVFCRTLINSIDHLIGDYVTFEEKK